MQVLDSEATSSGKKSFKTATKTDKKTAAKATTKKRKSAAWGSDDEEDDDDDDEYVPVRGRRGVRGR
jgi:hypothetical protein